MRSRRVGDALFSAVCNQGLEGVVAKRDRDPYRPGDRGWVKKKNPGWSRYTAEREAAMRERRKQFV